MPLFAVLLLGLTVLELTFGIVWLVQRHTRNAGMIDAIWAFTLGALAPLYALLGNGAILTRGLVAIGGLLWGLRLGAHLWRRNAGHAEDPRYRALRTEWGAQANIRMFWFFQVQAVAALLLSLAYWVPCFLATALGTLQVGAAVVIWVLAFAGEALADRQLRRFTAQPTHRGQVCRTGLWRYSRHPNYFCECLHWLAYVPLALNSPWMWLTLLPPVLMTWLLLKISGIPLLEAHLLRSRPGYADYIRSTSRLLPWPPRRHHQGDLQ